MNKDAIYDSLLSKFIKLKDNSLNGSVVSFLFMCDKLDEIEAIVFNSS